MSGAILPAEEWHAQRGRVVGGSEIAALFGVQPDYMLSHYALWMVKAGRVPPPDVDNPRTKWGLRLEEVISEACAEQEGWTVRKGGHVIDPTTPGLGCTLDYEITAGELGREDVGALELKNVDWLVHRRTWTDGEPPLHILLQLQHQLAATGHSWGAVASLVGGNDLHIYRFEARPRLIADIRRRVTAFWQSIAENRPPPVDGGDSATAVLRALHAEVRDEIAEMDADNELPEVCSGLLAATESRKAAERTEAEFKNRLIEKLGSHAKARTLGFFVSTTITPAKPPRAAEPGEVIPGRKESRRYTVKEIAA